MKQIVLIFTFLTLPLLSFAQNYSDSSIGLRLGGGNGYGAEISFQTPFKVNRAELDLGWGNGSHRDSWTLTGLYQWIMPIESGFYWYLGAGPAIGYWDEDKDDHFDNDGGLYIAASLNAGAEYKFKEVPLQISLDLRPELGLINRWDAVGGGLGLSVRYCF